MSNYFVAVAAIMGTMIGAGILGIPYVVKQAGFGIGVFHLILVALIIVLSMLYLGEIALRTRTRHQLSGYAEKYLGPRGKTWMFVSVAFGIYSAALAYLIGVSESLSFLLYGHVGYSLGLGVLFWVILSFVVYFGVGALKEAESIGIILVFVLVASIVLLFWRQVNFANLSYNNFNNVFVPFGVVLFAYLGFSIIPEVREILSGEKRAMKKAIISAIALVFLIYFIFTLIVVGTKGAETPELATLALGAPFILLGILTMTNAYLALSVALMDNFKFDFRESKVRAWLYTILIPVIAFAILSLLGLASFVKIIGIAGFLSGGLAAILIFMMHKNAKRLGDREPEYSVPYSGILNWILALLFVLGAVLEVWNLLF